MPAQKQLRCTHMEEGDEDGERDGCDADEASRVGQLVQKGVWENAVGLTGAGSTV